MQKNVNKLLREAVSFGHQRHTVSKSPLSRDKQNSSPAVAATLFSGLLCNVVISPNCRCKKQFAIDISED